MKDGYIQQVDTPQNLYDFPCNMFVAGFIGNPHMNFINGALNKNTTGYYLETNDDMLYIPEQKCGENLAGYIGETVTLGVRPEDIYDAEAHLAADGMSIINTTVEVRELMGSEVYLYLKYGENQLTARVASNTASKTGSNVKTALDMKKIHLFDTKSEEVIIN
jgi:multiple sugar transport system ATP-binding protein